MARWARAHAGTHSAVIFVRLSKDIPVKKNLSGCVFFTIVIAATVLTGCRLDSEQVQISDGNLYGVAENTILTCSDGIDNDNNGYKDCEDPNCKTRGTAEAPGPGDTVCPDQEDNIYVCSDGLDNDGDGFIDCEDNSCKSTASCCVATGNESTKEACSDGIDNDCNGYIDCADKNCSTLQHCTSLKCPSGTEPEDTFEKCTDGIDNDCNGYKDCEDNSCKKSKDPIIAQYCRLINCPSYVDGNTEDSYEACSDGIDNDCSGYIDCKDNSCKKSEDPQIKQYCANTPKPSCVYRAPEYDIVTCSDGIDNDCSGLADCADPTCKNSSDPDVQAYCRKILEDLANAAIPNLPTAIPEFNAELCSDGKDNDFNGVADCADPNCIALNLEYCSVKLTQEPPARPANFATLSASARAAILANEKDLCTDNIDNDRDGLVDCEEYQCMLRSLQTLTGDEAVYQFTCQTSTAQ